MPWGLPWELAGPERRKLNTGATGVPVASASLASPSGRGACGSRWLFRVIPARAQSLLLSAVTGSQGQSLSQGRVTLTHSRGGAPWAGGQGQLFSIGTRTGLTASLSLGVRRLRLEPGPYLSLFTPRGSPGGDGSHLRQPEQTGPCPSQPLSAYWAEGAKPGASAMAISGGRGQLGKQESSRITSDLVTGFRNALHTLITFSCGYIKPMKAYL